MLACVAAFPAAQTRIAKTLDIYVVDVEGGNAMKVLHSSPGLQDLWQLHFSQLSGQEYTVPGIFIANTADDQPSAMPIAALAAPPPGPDAPPPPAHNGASFWIKVSAQQDGSFTVTNSRNGFSKLYK